MSKIEFVKETDENGNVTYFTEINGFFVHNSIFSDIKIAKKKYNEIVQKKINDNNYIEVLESIEINRK